MTLRPESSFVIPKETVRVARAAYPKGNIYMQMRDALGLIYQDQSFAHLFPHIFKAFSLKEVYQQDQKWR